jgi:DDE superfamily endonuclease
VERWKSEEYPAIHAEAAAEGATIFFGDEAGVRTDFHAGTAWAPVGQTLVVRTTDTRDSINLIAALSAQGALRFSAYAGNTFINFCKRLMHDTSGTVFPIDDGHPVHRSKAVQDFMAST